MCHFSRRAVEEPCRASIFDIQCAYLFVKQRITVEYSTVQHSAGYTLYINAAWSHRNWSSAKIIYSGILANRCFLGLLWPVGFSLLFGFIITVYFLPTLRRMRC